MDYIHLPEYYLPIWIGAAIALVLAVIFMTGYTKTEDPRREKIRFTGFLVSLLGSGVLVVVALLGSVFTQQSAMVAQVKETYGVELNAGEAYKLNYPRWIPEKDFEVFGKFSMDSPTEDGFERVTTFLIWKDGKMMLASSPDGERFTELER